MEHLILDDFLSITEEGIYCRYGDFYLDAKTAVPKVVVSHGHGDHITSGSRKVYCTAPTWAFMVHRYGKNAGKDSHIYEYRQSFIIKEVVLTFFSAGHILGSAMVLMEYKGVRYLYTGDYKLQQDSTCEPIELVKADVLITESTFASPEWEHPNAITEIEKLKEVHFPIMLGTYSLGKAQRLTALINRHCPQKKILLHHAILPYHKIYEKCLPISWTYQPYRRKWMKEDDRGDMVYLVPPLTFNSYIRATNVVRVFASGWKKLQHKNNLELYISDHVDWKDILETIAVVKPRQIWTLHGDGTNLMNFLQGKIFVKML